MKIRIDQFRRIREAELDCSLPVTLLVGENQSGKSSILGAVTVALTGKHPGWLTRQGDSLYDLRHYGAKKASVSIRWGDLVADRTISAKSQDLTCGHFETGEWSGTTTEQQAALCEYFGLTQTQLACLLDAGQFLEMTTKEQTGFLAGISGAELTAEQLTARITKEITGECCWLPSSALPKLTGVELMDACLKIATQERRDTKKLLAEVETLSANALPASPPGECPESIEVELAGINKRKSDADRAKWAIEKADDAVASAQNRLDATKQALADADLTPPDVDIPALEADVAAKQADWEKASEHDKAAQSATIEAKRVEQAILGQIEDIEQALDTDKSVCHFCKQVIDKSLLEQKQGELREFARAAVADFEAAAAVSTETAAAYKSASDAVKSAEFALLEGRDALEAVSTRKRTLEASVAAANNALKSATDARSELPAPEDTEPIVAEIERLAQWIGYSETQKQEKPLNEHAASLRRDVAAWEWLVDKFGSGPDSYRAELLEGKLDTLKDAVNAAMQPLLHEEIVFPDGDGGLRVRGMGYENPATDEFLSGSQKLRLQIALQYGFCKALDFPLMLVDCEAALDPVSTAAILTFLKETAQSWPEVRILAAMAPTREDWKEHIAMLDDTGMWADWANVYAVVDGKTEPLSVKPGA